MRCRCASTCNHNMRGSAVPHSATRSPPPPETSRSGAGDTIATRWLATKLPFGNALCTSSVFVPSAAQMSKSSAAQASASTFPSST